jgi:hypothetical protein
MDREARHRAVFDVDHRSGNNLNPELYSAESVQVQSAQRHYRAGVVD